MKTSNTDHNMVQYGIYMEYMHGMYLALCNIQIKHYNFNARNCSTNVIIGQITELKMLQKGPTPQTQSRGPVY